jgi:hypothetical protein
MDEVKEVLKKEFNKTITIKIPPKPTNRNKNVYIWWRRYPTHKNLPTTTPYKDKIKNGDFDYSPYWKYIEYEYYWMMEDILKLRKQHTGGRDSLYQLERDIITSYNRRLKKLYEDAQLDEFARINDLKMELRRSFGGNKFETDDFINTFEGTIAEAFSEYPKWLINKK